MSTRVVARGFDGRVVYTATRIADRKDAERLAERIIVRSDVNAVDVTIEPAPPAQRRRSYR